MRYELDLNTESVHICVCGYSIALWIEVSPAIDHGNIWVIRATKTPSSTPFKLIMTSNVVVL